MTEQTSAVEHKNPYLHLAQDVSDIPAQIKWPVDEWGFSKDLRKALVEIAGKIGDNQQKRDIVEATLVIGLRHMQKRIAKDRRMQEHRMATRRRMAEARLPLEALRDDQLVKKENA